MKNYPEYPDNDDVDIKEMAIACGVDDFKAAKEIVELCRDLQQFGIMRRKMVRAAIHRWLGEFLKR
jgi:hypothetical protein